MIALERGKFIVVEGGEGSGKDTHIEALKKELPRVSTLFTREPGGTKRAEMIRSAVLFGDFDSKADALTNLLLFCAARSDHLQNRIIPALAGGTDVICNRYDASTFAYQIHGQGNHFIRDMFVEIHKEFWRLAPSTHYIYLDVEVEEGLRRAKSRPDQNFFDHEEVALHHRVRAGYLEFLEDRPHTIVDANGPLEKVQAEFISAVKSALI